MMRVSDGFTKRPVILWSKVWSYFDQSAQEFSYRGHCLSYGCNVTPLASSQSPPLLGKTEM